MICPTKIILSKVSIQTQISNLKTRRLMLLSKPESLEIIDFNIRCLEDALMTFIAMEQEIINRGSIISQLQVRCAKAEFELEKLKPDKIDNISKDLSRIKIGEKVYSIQS